MDSNTVQSLLERVGRLEAENRRLKRGAALALLTVVALATAGAQGVNRVRVIEAEKIILRDEKGAQSIVLEGAGAFPKIGLFDKKGKERVWMEFNPEVGGVVAVEGDESGLGAGMVANRHGAAYLRVSEPNDEHVAIIAEGGEHPHAEVQLGNLGTGNTVNITSINKKGMISILEEKKIRLHMSNDGEGGVLVGTNDRDGNDRLMMGQNPDGSPFMKFMSGDGKVLLQRP
jgi:hypothetical protein